MIYLQSRFNKMTRSDRSPTNRELATDQFKLLFELVGDRSVTVPKPISNQLHQLPDVSREVADQSPTSCWQPKKNHKDSSAILMNFDR